MRTTVRFEVDGDFCEAWIYRPDGGGEVPVIVMAHGLGGIKDMRLAAFAERFTDAGYACLVFDHRHFGGSSGDPAQLLSIRRQHEDWRAALAYARTDPLFNASRVVAWGTSFGGGNVLAIAAADSQLAAAIVQCPFTDGIASVGVMPARALAGVGLAALRDLVAGATGRPPVYVAAAGRAGSIALMSAPDTWEGVARLTSDLPHYDNRITARSALAIMVARPGRVARHTRVPIFAALCEHDTVAPAGKAQAQISRIACAEIHLYDAHHFEIYTGAAFERIVADELAFLQAHVPVASLTHENTP